jgi:hypothetical protein
LPPDPILIAKQDAVVDKPDQIREITNSQAPQVPDNKNKNLSNPDTQIRKRIFSATSSFLASCFLLVISF